MSKPNYQVVGACANFTTASPTGPSKQYLYKGAWVPGDVPQAEIDHHLSVGLIAPVDDPYNTPVDGNGNDTPLGEPTATADDGEQAKADDGDAKRAAARAKLPTDGSAPDGRASHDVWVEYAVAKGMDRGEAEKASKADLQGALKS